ncbi:MAG: RNase adapter RapZ [Candidatus Eremiobacteraeota bacterium]|nr:RNase adapter RapZ [Candidatus Eremiobacteraeota bacterium]
MTAARIIFVAGLSGAGKSQAMKTFEDLGFYCVEHLPPAALDQTLNVLDAARVSDVAVTLDAHGDVMLGDAIAAIERARAQRDVSLVYMEARNDALVRRFSETRRRHPFAERGSLREAIAAEREALLPLRERATMTIDTTALTHGDLKERLAATFAPEQRAQLTVTLVPFGFKYGLPLDLDLLFDVRFLRNPNYDDTLRPLTGEDPAVAAFIEADAACKPFVAKLIDVMDFLLPRYIAEGKAQLTVGIGCTGGRHRSVYIARCLYDHLAANDRLALAVDPRDIR